MKTGLAARCPDCGTELPSDGAIAGLCPRCLVSLALHDSDADLEELETLDGPAPGRILGERYQMRELLGRGGMGEVWRAFDLKLRVDVALKAIRPERIGSGRAQELLRQEVRSAREVVSPNVCRIFDLVVEDGQELVSMEFIDGTTLAETLRVRGPLPLQEAREIASQFLSGLEAIHQAGLVHRDFKPENVMLTRAGRVVVMDFGLAKGRAEAGTGTIAGTPAYMSPEQARGEHVDARADVFSAGVVLAEMLSVGGDGVRTRQALWRGLRDVPPDVPEGPWAPVLKQALSPAPEARHASAHALARALEEVTLRLPGFEEKRPYPGLASFTEEDAEFFFGRELEVEAIWKKLKRPRLLALIGPSGAGKSSFLRAGLLPKLPKSWAAVVSTPGERPFRALAQALVPQLTTDTEALQALVRFEEPDTAVTVVSRWRKRHENAVVIVDQFEELFTQNPKQVQAAFAQLLGGLVLEADTHVFLALRDDFLFHCHAHEALAPAFSDLTPLGPLSEGALRRALVQPALSCGYRFENEALIEKMVSAVKGERGALPLLAFAASRLWDLRDGERGLLTSAAFREIGGVAGSLAQHAEATLDRIGAQRIPLVRELFRNLVTAQGTRAMREREELLSIFEGATRTEGEDVLNALVDARLLTSYERAREGGESHQQVEIIHESLLSAWPRLVRWQAQDQDGALLRDQLRQAAQVWQDRGRPEDLLWSGTAYRDLALWRERYPGGLSANEEAFAQAATGLNGRRRRHRRLAVAAALVTATLVTTGALGLWQRSEVSRQKAEVEARERQAAELLALGRLHLEEYPTAALAHAIASLERSDNEPARRFAVEALWRGPTAHLLTDAVVPIHVKWSPDGRWLATGGTVGLVMLDGDGRRLPLASLAEMPVGFSSDGTRFVSRGWGEDTTLHLWSLPEGKLLTTWPSAGRRTAILIDQRLLTFTFDPKPPARRAIATVEERSIDGGPTRTLGRWLARDLADWDVDAAGELLFSIQGGRLVEQRLERLDAPARIFGRQQGKVSVWARPWTDRVVTADASGEVRVWNAATARVDRVLRSPASALWVALDPKGRFLATAPGGPLPTRAFSLFDLELPRLAEPTILLQKEKPWLNDMAIHPQGHWLASGQAGSVLLWNLAARRSRVLRGQKGVSIAVAFTPDGRLVSTSDEGVVRLWALHPGDAEPVRVLRSEKDALVGYSIDVDARGRFAVVAKRFRGEIVVVPLDGSPPRTYRVQRSLGNPVATGGPTIDPTGQRVAFLYTEFGNPEAASIRIMDLSSGTEQILRATTTTGACEDVASLGAEDEPAWLPDGRLVSDGTTGLRVWDLPTRSSRQLRPCRASVGTGSRRLRPTPDSRSIVSLAAPGTTDAAPSDLSIVDVETGISRDITSHGTRLQAFALDPRGTTLVTASADGLVRAGPLTGETPHLLYGHNRAVTSVAVSPDGRWIASGSDDDTIRLWPMPEGPPFHTLPYQELLDRLRALTNLRVLAEPDSATGYKLEPGPFPGWAQIPEW